MGTLPNGEIFNTGFWFVGTSDGTQAQATLFAEQVRQAFNGAPGEVLRSLVPASATFVEVRTYFYPNPTGGASLQGVAPIGAPGTGSMSNAHPLQVCIVATLLTGLAGRQRRGRMYWPMLTEQLPNHQLTQARAQVIADAVAGLFTQFMALEDLTRVVVMSQVGQGQANFVTAVSVDSEPDIQRRRANRQVELFQAQAVVTG